MLSTHYFAVKLSVYPETHKTTNLMHSRFILRYLYLNVRIIEFNLPSVTKHTGVFLILTRTFTTNKTFSSINKFQRHCTIFWIEILTTAIIIIKKK